jgi:hypothetical protein
LLYMLRRPHLVGELREQAPRQLDAKHVCQPALLDQLRDRLGMSAGGRASGPAALSAGRWPKIPKRPNSTIAGGVGEANPGQ